MLHCLLRRRLVSLELLLALLHREVELFRRVLALLLALLRQVPGLPHRVLALMRGGAVAVGPRRAAGSVTCSSGLRSSELCDGKHQRSCTRTN